MKENVIVLQCHACAVETLTSCVQYIGHSIVHASCLGSSQYVTINVHLSWLILIYCETRYSKWFDMTILYRLVMRMKLLWLLCTWLWSMGGDIVGSFLFSWNVVTVFLHFLLEVLGRVHVHGRGAPRMLFETLNPLQNSVYLSFHYMHDLIIII